MAVHSITAENVLTSTTSTASSVRNERIAAEAIDVGEVVALDNGDPTKVALADANDSGLRKAIGIALNSALAGQPVDYIKEDANFTPGFTGLASDIVVLSGSTPGGMHAQGELVATWWGTVMGVMLTDTTMCLKITQGGVTQLEKA